MDGTSRDENYEVCNEKYMGGSRGRSDSAEGKTRPLAYSQKLPELKNRGGKGGALATLGQHQDV